MHFDKINQPILARKTVSNFKNSHLSCDVTQGTNIVGIANSEARLTVTLFPRLKINITNGDELSSFFRYCTMNLPRPLVICGPSGSGKSTILKKLFEEYGKYLGFSISHTTRQPRPGEVNGREYHFVTKPEMEDAIKAGDFIEHTQFSGNLYGTSKKAIQDVQNQGKICILDIEVEGVKNIKKTNVNPQYIFVKPKNLQVLEERLRGRGTETETSLRKRLDTAESELEYGETTGNFDAIIINDSVDDAYKQLKEVIVSDIKLLMEK
ncbi:Guanylate kinase [Nymphon striatum]|nr:Guanylate kinase [Nymphon striatum]